MSYLDAYLDKNTNMVNVISRIDGKLINERHNAPYYFYFSHPNGSFKSLYGEPVEKLECLTKDEMFREVAMMRSQGIRTYETDISPINRILMEKYRNTGMGAYNVAFIDIETGFSATSGYAPADDPFNPITAIAIYRRWLPINEAITSLAVIPPGMDNKTAKELTSHLSNVHLFDDDAEMLKYFATHVDDIDLYCGWNSTLFDFPYIINRIGRLISTDYITEAFGRNNIPPKKRTFIKFKTEKTGYDSTGKVLMDYMDLVSKYAPGELPSYKLDSVAEIFVGEKKVEYEGSLDALYKQDFKKFIEYNRQDVALLDKIDKVKKYLDLSNQIAHDACVIMAQVRGSVAWIENMIILDAHDKNMVVLDKDGGLAKLNSYGRPKDDIIDDIMDDVFEEEDDEEEDSEIDEVITESSKDRVAGAYVALPRSGKHDFVGSCDVESMYPSSIMSLNMDITTLVGQVLPTETNKLLTNKLKTVRGKKSFAKAWEGIFHTVEYELIMNKDDNIVLTLVLANNGGEVKLTGSQIYDIIKNDGLILSPNSTIFHKNFQGLLPAIINKWKTERREWRKKIYELEALKDTASDIDKEKFELEISQADIRQYNLKIRMNSVYGATGNAGFRFIDRLGEKQLEKSIAQSVTLTGRMAVRHMSSELNRLITGTYEYEITPDSALLYGDTDSLLGSSILDSNLFGKISIEDLFNKSTDGIILEDKEYAFNRDVKIQTYDNNNGKSYYDNIEYIYRHKVHKDLWEIEDENGNMITITNDHSIMVERDGKLIECKPQDILETDILIIDVK